MVPRQYVESVIYGQSNSQRFIVNDQCSGNYKTIVKDAFDDNQEMQKALKQAFEDFINKVSSRLLVLELFYFFFCNKVDDLIFFCKKGDD